MSVRKDPKSPYYQYEFQIDGDRFRGSTKARNKKDAELVERDLRAKAQADLKQKKATGGGPLLMRHAAGAYYDQVGQYHACKDDTFRDLARLVEYFGPNRRLDEITHDDAAAMVAWRRQHTIKGQTVDKHGNPVPRISPSTVNRSTTMVLKKLFTHAKAEGKRFFPNEPVWRKLWLKEPAERVRELSAEEGDALDAAVRDDYAPWLEFARLTGLRRKETLIRWTAVNLTTGQIRTLGKRGKWVSTPITAEVRALLDQARGHHPDFVFTYVAASTRDGRVKGQRYPITQAGAKTHWRRLRAKSGVEDFRFHDIRHDVGTKLLRETGNMKLVKQVLNHSTMRTTERYAHVLDGEVSEALSHLAKSRKKPRTAPANAA